jgi:putative transposase
VPTAERTTEPAGTHASPPKGLAVSAAIREPHLNEHLFRSLLAAQHTLHLWRVDYNTQQPHTSLDGLTPFAFANRSVMDHNPNGLWL